MDVTPDTFAVWCGIANGAEDVLIPEKYDYDEQKLIDNIVESRKKGKKHHIIVNAEGIGHSGHGETYRGCNGYRDTCYYPRTYAAWWKP